MNRNSYVRARAAEYGSHFSRWIVFVVVIVSPWLFGGAESWAALLLCMLVNAGLIAWLLSAVLSKINRFVDKWIALAGVAFLAFIGWQAMPLPTPFVKWISPHISTYQSAYDGLSRQINSLPAASSHDPSTDMPEKNPAWQRISVCPTATMRSLYLAVAYAGVFIILASTLSNWHRIRWLVIGLLISGFALALFGMIQFFSRTELIYWFYKPPLGGTFFGPFTNRNHFACYMNMLLGPALGFLLVKMNTRELRSGRSWRAKLAWLSTSAANRTILTAYIMIIMAGSVFVSLSRGGIACLLLSFGLMAIVAAMTRHSSRRHRSVFGMMILLVGIIVFWMGWEPIMNRLGSLADIAYDPLHDSRTLATLATFKMWTIASLSGIGLGAFEYLFPVFQVPDLQFGRFLHAHNDYAQFLAEGGILGLGLFAWLAILFVRLLIRHWPRDRSTARQMTWGILAGLLTVFFHSFIDFSLRKPANALLLSTLCALCVATVRSPPDNGNVEPEAPIRPRRRAPKTLRMLFLLCIAGLVWLTWTEWKEFGGELAYTRFMMWAQAGKQAQLSEYAQAAIEISTKEADVGIQYLRGNPDTLADIAIYNLQNVRDVQLIPELRIQLATQALKAAGKTVCLAPSDYEYWLWLGRAYGIMGNSEAARICLARALELAPPNWKPVSL